MEYTNGLLPSSSEKWNQRPSQGYRKIFYLRSGHSLDRCLRMKISGVRPIRYLSHLGMIIGEYMHPAGRINWKGSNTRKVIFASQSPSLMSAH